MIVQGGMPGQNRRARRQTPQNRVLRLLDDVYQDPFKWSLVKGVVGFALGVIVARQLSEEFANQSLSA